jgi:hypothetical protein
MVGKIPCPHRTSFGGEVQDSLYISCFAHAAIVVRKCGRYQYLPRISTSNWVVLLIRLKTNSYTTLAEAAASQKARVDTGIGPSAARPIFYRSPTVPPKAGMSEHQQNWVKC